MSSSVYTRSFEITAEQRELSLPMADMMARQSPDEEGSSSLIYLLGDGIHVTVDRPYPNGTIPLLISDDKLHGDGGWTPGFVNGRNFRVKRAYWGDEDGILVPTGVLEPIVDAMELTEPRPSSKNMREYIEIRRRALELEAADGVDIEEIRMLRDDLAWAAFKGTDLV